MSAFSTSTTLSLPVSLLGSISVSLSEDDMSTVPAANLTASALSKGIS